MNLVQETLQAGGRIAPLVIAAGHYRGIGYMNPSVLVDDDGDILVNLRHINYTLYHSENKQMFPSFWGPLSYIHPESDMYLRTINYLCRLDDTLSIMDYTMVDTTDLDVEPLWEFVGLEDARLVSWEGSLYQVGVRRDTTPNGVGRMEYSKVRLDKESWTASEVFRTRIQLPDNGESYCEKNWMPILDNPFHFIKWTAPTEVIKADPKTGASVVAGFNYGKVPPRDQRGGSQVFRWKDKYIAFTHEVYLFNNYVGQKDGTYRHRVCVYNDNMELIGFSPEPLTFFDTRIEFCAGAAPYGDDLLVTFGYQDNMAFILQMPGDLVDKLVQEALDNEQ